MSIRLLVCDLDNTLYDWVAFFVPAFYAMVDEAVEILGCDKEDLLSDLREIHQKYHDAEHPFALLETKTVARCLATLSINERRNVLDPAFKAFNSVRKKSLRLYPGVRETLETLTNKNIKLVAHSESRVYSVMFRMKFLQITDFFEQIYCLERPLQTFVNQERAENFWSDFPTQKIVEISHHQRKPNPVVLGQIIENSNLNSAEAAYIGDSVSKDMLMAKQASCRAIWAEYGTKHDKTEYQRLVRISHWTPEEVARESELKELAKAVQPDFVAKESFAEVLNFLC